MLENYLKKLVSFKTVTSDKKANKKALDWCARELKKSGFKTKFLKSSQAFSLYAGKKLHKNPRILLSGHIDVVNATSSLFRLQKKVGKFVGRGVFDMKYAIACYLSLAKEKKLLMDKTAVLITTDEEIGGKNGTGYFIKQNIKPNVCILPDGGKDFIFERSAKGILQIKIISKGVSAHGSRPWLGINALENLMEYLIELKKKFPKEPCKDSAHNHNTISINVINSGDQTNRVPDLAEARVDIRIAPGFSSQKIKTIVFKLAKKYLDIKIFELSSANSFVVPNNNFFYRNFLNITRKHTGKDIQYLDSPGSCDARYFLAKKIPTVIVRPNGGGHHTENEWIGQKSLMLFYSILKEFIEQNGK